MGRTEGVSWANSNVWGLLGAMGLFWASFLRLWSLGYRCFCSEVEVFWGCCCWFLAFYCSNRLPGGGHFLCGGKESNQRKPLVCASGPVLLLLPRLLVAGFGFWFLAFYCSNRLPGGGVTFFAAAKKVTKESRSCVPPGPFLSLPRLRCCRGPALASALLSERGTGSHAIRAFSPTLVTVPFGLLRPARAAGVSPYGQPAVNFGNDLARDIAFFVIRPYLG
jgi:hypothetical protein